MLGLALSNEPAPHLLPTALSTGQQSMFVIVANVNNSAMMNINTNPGKGDYGAPGSTKFRRKMQVARASTSEKYGVAKYKVVVRSPGEQSRDQHTNTN